MLTEAFPYMVVYLSRGGTQLTCWSKISMDLLDHVHKSPSEAWILPTFWLGFEGLNLLPEEVQ